MNNTPIFFIAINFISVICVNHIVADFVFQTRKMAENKADSLKWLSIHVATYGVIFTILCLLLFGIFFRDVITLADTLKYCLLNTMIHFGVDYVTSRITKHFYLKAEMIKEQYKETEDIQTPRKKIREAMKGFWTTIAVDQLIHFETLYQTLKFFT